MSDFEYFAGLLRQASKEDRRKIFEILRKEFTIHQIESDFNVNAERILEAVSRSDDLSKRGIRGLIAEATFVLDLVPRLAPLKMQPIEEVQPYDCLLKDDSGVVRVQIKMQRREKQRPKLACQMRQFSRLPEDFFVVETQRTRGGTNADGSKTRPYRFGEFDILGVCLHPSSNDWQDFVFTLSSWLLPHRTESGCLATYQPVSPRENDDWTRDFLKCVEWLRQGQKKSICSGLLCI
jgi:hypothetical protein